MFDFVFQMPHESTVEHEKTLFDVPAGLSLDETIRRLQTKQKEQAESVSHQQAAVQPTTAQGDTKKSPTCSEVKPSIPIKSTKAVSTSASSSSSSPIDDSSRKSSTIPHLFPQAPKDITHHHDTDEEDSSTESN